MNITLCDSTSRLAILERINKLSAIISTYEWIINAYVSDFYTKGFWNKLPVSLQNYFDATQSSDLSWMLSHDHKKHNICSKLRRSTVPPLSLLALHQNINILALQRTAIDTGSTDAQKTILDALSSKDFVVDSREEFTSCASNDSNAIHQTSLPAGRAPNYKNGQCMDMQHIFRKHVKPKKQHEINNLGQIIHLVTQAANTVSVVDVGAGLGHLARLLAFQHHLHVTTIEATGGHAPKATEYDKDLRKSMHKAKIRQRQQVLQQQKQASLISEELKTDSQSSKHPLASSHLVGQNTESESRICDTSSLKVDNPEAEVGLDSSELPSHVICTIEPNIAASQFVDILVKRANTEQPSKQDGNFVLASLHACGDLTPTILRVFLNCPAARGLASVSCCYMKMTATAQSPRCQLTNFPMSSCLTGQPLQSLSYEAREMACHFADAYRQRLIENPPHLKIHSYRAALQLLVTSVDPSFKSGQARLISKKGANGTFLQYAAENLKKLNIDISSVPDALMTQCEDLTQEWKRVVAFYTLRLSLAPLVESLLLLDRALFLLEHGVSSLLVPIFDSNISPRNFVLLACKQ